MSRGILTASDCVPCVTLIGQPVITSITFFGKYRVPVETMAFPEGSTFTVGALASMFGVARQTIWNQLCVHRARLDPPMYRRHRRLLTWHDMEVLRTVFTVRVKR